MSEMSDKKEATVWGFGYKVPVESAAFLNGVMGHARDFEHKIKYVLFQLQQLFSFFPPFHSYKQFN